MSSLAYAWLHEGITHRVEFVHVEGTRGTPYIFGMDGGEGLRLIQVKDFYISTTPVTQSLWAHPMREPHDCCNSGPLLPVENISWDELTQPEGFFARLYDSEVAKILLAQASLNRGIFRLPSESEWENAARGGPQWRDGYRYSGSNDIDLVAWYDRKGGDHTQDVARKSPNQLGLFDMSGNVWEWCQDLYTKDVNGIPQDGTPTTDNGPEHVLRGGRFHNWAIHCTVSKRYHIEKQYHDGCIGFRIVMAEV